MQATRVAIFYDGSYFRQGNLYFRYKEKRGWISLPSLHALLERYVAAKEKVAEETTKLVEAHYYDGRVSTEAAREGQLEKDRGFELALLDAGIVPHYLPLREIPKNADDPDAGFMISQKGVDVNIALDSLDLAHANRYDVAVLFTGDEDFVPLVRKVTSLGKRVLVAHFDVENWTGDDGKPHRGTFVSRKLKDVASYTLNMNHLVKDTDWKNDVKALFFKPKE